MLISRQVFRVAILISLWLGTATSQTQQSLVREKLHPAFQALIAGQVIDKSATREAGLSKSGDSFYEASIRTTNADAVRALGIKLNSTFGTIATARVTKEDLRRLVELSDVQYVDPGSINYPALDVSIPEIGANLLHSGFLNNTQYKGNGVIVVIYDTGIDWRHLDFRDPTDTTKSRILSIWDQTLTLGSGESYPSGMNYGVEYTKQQIENEIDGTPAGVVRERDTNGHGTHVAGIIAGNGRSSLKRYTGVAPEADIIVVKGGDASFTSIKMIDGLTYAASKASAAGKSVVVNWSIGGQSGPHDGTRDYEVAVDNFVQTAGRVVVISAGNDGDKLFHADGIIASGGSATISVNVPIYTPTAGASNDKFTLEVWFRSDLGVTATVTTPNGITVSAGKDNTGSATNKSDGSVVVTNYRGTSNYNRYVLLEVQDEDASKVPSSGKWTLTLSGATLPAEFDAWLSAYAVGDSTATIVNGNTQKTVSSPGTSNGAITVASYVTKNGWPSVNGGGYVYSATTPMLAISSFSSQGPTGDGRMKPEIAAPGHGISSALSGWAESATSTTRIMPDGKHTLLQGTSMAAPHVTGASALLLQISKNLTAAQIKTLLTSTAITDAFTGAPNNTWGYGKMDILQAAAKAVGPQVTVQRQILSSDAEGSSNLLTQPLTGSAKLAYRFSPTFSGQLTGIYVNFSSAANRSIAGTGSMACEIWSNASGSPGSKLGSTVLKPFQNMTFSTNNFVDMLSTGVNVNSGLDYHVVIYTSNSQDTLRLRTDQSASPSDRYSVTSGGSWSHFTSGGNPRIRATVASPSMLVWAEPDNLVPLQFDLSQNYPNPFNPATAIRYAIPHAGRVRLRVFDLVGREVASLVDEEQIAGQYFIRWNATDNSGRFLSTGVYFYKLESGGKSIAKKMLLMK